MMKPYAAVLSTCALFAAALPGQAATSVVKPPVASLKRVALVVGNARYTGVPELTNSINDSADICATLGDLGFDTLCVNDIPTLAEFKRRLGEFRAKLGPGTAGVFYYAGHGIEIDGENYLIPTTALVKRREDVQGETLSMRDVMDTLSEAKTDFNLVILDACRNSPFTRGFARTVWRSIGPVAEAPAGSLVLYATGANEQASDGNQGERNSPFAKHLLANMRQPGLPVESLIKRVSAAVQAETLKATGHKQTPYSYGAFTGEFCFAGCTGPGGVAVGIPPEAVSAPVIGKLDPEPLVPGPRLVDTVVAKEPVAPPRSRPPARVFVPPSF